MSQSDAGTLLIVLPDELIAKAARILAGALRHGEAGLDTIDLAERNPSRLLRVRDLLFEVILLQDRAERINAALAQAAGMINRRAEK